MTYKKFTTTEYQCDGPKCKEVKPVKKADSGGYGYSRPSPPPGWITVTFGSEIEDRHFHTVPCLTDYAKNHVKKRKDANERRQKKAAGRKKAKKSGAPPRRKKTTRRKATRRKRRW